MGTPNKIFNLVRVATATTGTGTMTLGSVVPGFLTPATASIPDATVVTYTIADGQNTETGKGTYHTTGTTLSRDTVYNSTAAGAKITLSGFAIVSLSISANDFNALVPTIDQFVAWAITDASGAGLTFTLTESKYFQWGKLVFAGAKIQWPTTANAAQASISLPVASVTSIDVPLIGTGGTSHGSTGASNSSILLYNVTGTSLTNAALSTKILSCNFVYRAA